MDAMRGDGGTATLAELASVAPGPGLASALAVIDRSAVGADAMLDVIAARARLLWHVQGELLADLARAVEATRAAESVCPDPRPDPVSSVREVEDRVVDAVGTLLTDSAPASCAELVGWTLHWARRFAKGQVLVAEAVQRRLPMVLAAVRDGQIDQAKAEAFVDALSCVNDEVAVRIATRLLPKARTWTLTELRNSLRYHVNKADPKAARRRYRRKVAERDVWLQAQPDGTATLSAQGLVPHRAAAAYDRIDRIARAARAGGDVRTLGQLRADALCDVLAGVPFQLSPTTDPLTAQADAQAQYPLERVPAVPNWTTESRFPNEKTTSDRTSEPDRTSGHDGGGGCDGPERRDRGGGGSGGGPCGGGGPGNDGPHGTDRAADAARSDLVPVPPELEPVGIIDLYDYDRACLTDQDLAWVTIGCEPPGAADDETPDWWHLCHPRPQPRQQTAGPQPRYETAGPQSRCEAVGSQPQELVGWDSRSETRILWIDAGDRLWATAQAGALLEETVLSRDVLPGNRCACGGRLTVRPGVVDVQVKLTTLAGLDEDPGLIPGLGVILAPLARRIAFDLHTRPTWRWSIFDTHGDLLHHGLTRARPAGPEYRFANEKTEPQPDGEPTERLCSCPRVDPGRRRGVVELQLTPATLHELITDPGKAPGWGAVLADIAAQVEQDRRLNPPGKWEQTDEHGNLRHHGHTGRMPDATEEAFIRARDRSCRAPHCQIPASRCELDHRIEYAKGGPSHRGCVDLRCKRHHHLRDRYDVRITRTGRTVTWTIPSGRTFTVTTDKDIILTRED